MRKPRPIPADHLDQLASSLKSTRTKSEFQHVQCIWLRAAFGLSASQIATAIGWHVSSVRRIHALYLKKGPVAFQCPVKGGRHRQNITTEEEERFLADFIPSSSQGGVIIIQRLKASYEQLIGRKVPKSTVYRLLARHGWRKIAPRPYHPKADQENQEAFKKTSRTS
jgi:transposase